MKMKRVEQSPVYGRLLKKLQREILLRGIVEKKLKESELHYSTALKESRNMQEQMRHLSRQIILGQEEERKEISRELHDEIGQTLAGINVHLGTLKVEALANTKGLKKKITRTQRLVEKSLNIVHRFARDLRPTILDDLGLIPALNVYLKGFSKVTGIPIRFTAFSGVEKLNISKRTVLYRVVQAALTNVTQHAEASLVKLTIRKHHDAIDMQISDNGKAFLVDQVLYAKKNKRLGLLGMRERVEMVGGSFSVESHKGTGTTIGAQIPFDLKKGPAK